MPDSATVDWSEFEPVSTGSSPVDWSEFEAVPTPFKPPSLGAPPGENYNIAQVKSTLDTLNPSQRRDWLQADIDRKSAPSYGPIELGLLKAAGALEGPVYEAAHPVRSLVNLPEIAWQAIQGRKTVDESQLPLPPGYNPLKIEIPPDANIAPGARPFVEAGVDVMNQITDPDVLATLPVAEAKVFEVPALLGKVYTMVMGGQLPKQAMDLKDTLQDPNATPDEKKKAAAEFALIAAGTVAAGRGFTRGEAATSGKITLPNQPPTPEMEALAKKSGEITPKAELPPELAAAAQVLPRTAAAVKEVQPAPNIKSVSIGNQLIDKTKTVKPSARADLTPTPNYVPKTEAQLAEQQRKLADRKQRDADERKKEARQALAARLENNPGYAAGVQRVATEPELAKRWDKAIAEAQTAFTEASKRYDSTSDGTPAHDQAFEDMTQTSRTLSKLKEVKEVENETKVPESGTQGSQNETKPASDETKTPQNETEVPDATQERKVTGNIQSERVRDDQSGAPKEASPGSSLSPEGGGPTPTGTSSVPVRSGQIAAEERLTPAVRVGNQIFTGKNHGEIIVNAAKQGEDATGGEKGFVQGGKFITRKEAAGVFEQQTGKKPAKEGELHSEDLKAEGMLGHLDEPSKPLNPGGSQSDLPPEKQAQSKVNNGPAAFAAQQTGWTFDGVNEAPGMSTEGMTPEMKAQVKPMLAFTDRRKGSPTEGITTYVPVDAKYADIVKALKDKAESPKTAANQIQTESQMVSGRIKTEPPANVKPQSMPAGPGAATAGVPGEGSGMPTIEDQISGKLAPVRPQPQAVVSAQAAPTANGMIAALKSGMENVKGWIGGLAGKTFPRTTLKSKQLGELGARWISSRIAAKPVAQVFAADVLGDSGVDSRKFGAALTEDNLRSVKKAFTDKGDAEKADGVFTLIGKDGSPFKTEAEYQDFLKDPKVQQVIARHLDLWKNVVEPQYRQAMQTDPDVELPSRGLQTGARINLRAVLEDENSRDVVRSVGRGNLLGTLRRRSPFGVQAKGTGEAYHINYYDLMENTFGKQLEIANKNAFENEMVKQGQAVIAPPGETVMIDGKKAVPFPLKRQRVILPSEEGVKGVSQNKNIYINARLATEYRIAANVDMKPPLAAIQHVNRVLNTAAIASGTDATTHMMNLTSSLMTLPGTAGKLLHDSILSALPGRPDALVSVARALVKGFQDNRAQLASLAEIGALKEQHEPTGLPGLRHVSQAIQWLDRTTRLALDDSYKRLAQGGIVENSETARREFVNQIGQYNKRAQGFYTRFFRDSGLGPFVTAGKTFNTLGVRAATLNPGVSAANLPAALALRANMAAKIAGTVGTIATLNYLLTKDKKGGGAMGRPGVPLGAIDLGTDDKNGRPQYLSIFNMTSAGRGLRVLGIRGIIQAKLQGLPNEVALDSGARDIINSAIAPWAGPPIRFGVEAATGYPTAVGVGRTTPVVPPGQSQHIADFKEALIQSSPVTAGIEKARQTGSTGLTEVLTSQLPRFTPQPGKPPSMMADYPAIVRRAQANSYIDDVIGRARKIEPKERAKFLQEAVSRLDNIQDKAKAWQEFRYRKVM